jgi:hypothetical protein
MVEENPLLPLPKGMQIDPLQEVENEVSIMVVATHPTSNSPVCRQPSSSIQSRYRRTVRAAPCAGVVERGELYSAGYHLAMQAIRFCHNVRMGAILETPGWPGRLSCNWLCGSVYH